MPKRTRARSQQCLPLLVSWAIAFSVSCADDPSAPQFLPPTPHLEAIALSATKISLQWSYPASHWGWSSAQLSTIIEVREPQSSSWSQLTEAVTEVIGTCEYCPTKSTGSGGFLHSGLDPGTELVYRVKIEDYNVSVREYGPRVSNTATAATGDNTGPWQELIVDPLGDQIHFLNANVGLVGSYYGDMFRTMDGGETWIRMELGYFGMNDIEFGSLTNGMIIGFHISTTSGLIARTGDAGLTWTPQPGPGLFDIPGRDIEVAGDYAYVVGESVLEVIEIAAPDLPKVVGSIDLPWTHRLAVQGSEVYVVGGGSLQIVGVSAPASPFVLGSVDLPGAHEVVVEGGQAYVSGEDLFVVDVATPSAPVVVGSVDTLRGRTGPLAISGHHVLVAEFFAGGGWPPVGSHNDLHVIDVATPASPAIVGSIEHVGTDVSDVAVLGDYAYLVGRTLTVIDISVPDSPTLVGWVDAGGKGIEIASNYAYVSGPGTLIDVSAPASPQIRTSFTGRGRIALASDRAYCVEPIGRFTSGLQVIDITYPEAPTTGWGLRSVAYVDASNAWVVGDDGAIRKTADGGTTWTVSPSGTTEPLHSVFFLDVNTGWASGGLDEGMLLRTQNGGSTWELVRVGAAPGALICIRFWDAIRGLAVSGGRLLATSDGGSTWTDQNIDDASFGTSDKQNNSISLYSSNVAVVVGDDGVIIRTDDGGATWRKQESGMSAQLYGVQLIDEMVGFAVGYKTILRTTTGGE